jgi:5'-methylthioadenosine phosphorylase
MATDYDCWREGHDAVTVETVVATMTQNAHNAQAVILAAASLIRSHNQPSPFANCLKGAIMTEPARIPPHARRNLKVPRTDS